MGLVVDDSQQKGLSASQAEWRDQIATRLARALASVYLLATAVLTFGIRGRWERLAMIGWATVSGLVLLVPVITGRPRGRPLAWMLVTSGIVSSLAGFALVGFLAGPSMVLVLTLVLAGLLLGRRVMFILSVAIAFGIGAIAWAMVQGVIPAPEASDVSMVAARPWIRTITVTFLAATLFGGLIVEIVARIEAAHENTLVETRRREQAERARAKAEMASLEAKRLETVGRLAAGVAHDFNNNLTAIMGCAELLKLELTGPSSLTLVEDILKSSRNAAELTRQLLAYSRKAPAQLVPTDIHQSLKDAVTLARRSISPSVTIDSQLEAGQSTVLADPTMLENALLNLIINAGDAMPNGGQLTVSTLTMSGTESVGQSDDTPTPGPRVLVEILDTGVGIEAAHLPNIFDPFFTTKPAGKGTGLGLAAVAGTVRSLGGTIEVETEVNCGTAFRIFLPCTNGSPKSSRESPELVRGSGRLLVVDDEPSVRNSASALLQTLGYSVTTASGGKSAIEAVENSPNDFDLVLLDLRMPEMPGEVAFEALRQRAPRLPILIWSGYGAETDVATLLKKGALGFVQKPYRIADLSQIIHDALHGGPSAALKQ